MKILICTPNFHRVTHGPAKFAQQLHSVNFSHPNHEVRVLSEDDLGAELPWKYEVEVVCPRPFSAFINFFRMWKYDRLANKIRDSYPFDIIIFNHAVIALWNGAIRNPNYKTVAVINDDDYLRIDCSTFKEYSLRKWVIRRIHRLFEKLTVHNADLTITLSQYLKNEIQNKYRVNGEIVKTLHLTVDIERHDFQLRAISINNPIKILFVKSNHIRGGLFNLIEALALLEQFSFEVSVIGEFGGNTTKIKNFFERYPSVKLAKIGPLPQKEVFGLMHTHDILCIPSIREGLGVANIEGLASGIPVVTTNVGGIPEVMDHGRNGWLAEPNDINSLATALNDCIMQPEERIKRSLAGRRFVEQNFTSEKMIANLLEMLENLLAERDA